MAAATAVRAVSNTLGSPGVTYTSGEEAPRRPMEEETAASTTLSKGWEDEREQVEEMVPSLPGWTRGDRIVGILIRPETLELIQGIEDQNQEMVRDFPFGSQEKLHTFAALVSEDLLSLSHDGSLVLTPLAERLIGQVADLE